MSGQKQPHSEAGGSCEPPIPDIEPDPVQQLLIELAALRQFAAHYVAAKFDETADGLRALRRHALVVLLASVMLAALVVGLVTLVIQGIDGALGELLGRPWLGHIVTGMTGLGVLYFSLTGFWRKSDHVLGERRAREYEKRKARQHEMLGRNVDESGDALDQPAA